MANGLEIERKLFEALEQRGFRFAPPASERDDVLFKLDRVVVAPALSGGACFFPSPIGVQVTLRHGDWAKRAEFLEVARSACARLAYVEIIGDEIGEEFFNAVAAVLTAMFFDEGAPKEALVTVRANRYRVCDLAGEVERYRVWLATQISDELAGQVILWRSGERYGFISAPTQGPDGRVEPCTFFFRHPNVADAELVSRLAQVKGSGELLGNDRIPVVFSDAGHTSAEHWRKEAMRVALRKS